MKKLYFLAMILAFFAQVSAQTLNQPSGWPNSNWSITGQYNSDAIAFESDPTSTTNFAYDDDDAGDNTEDNIAAESPIIDLTAAFTANEKAIEVTAMYGYVYLENDALRLQYWDADTSTWTAWGTNIAGNDSDATDNFCAIVKTQFISEVLDISSFTATQLAGFRYRIAYDDNLDGVDWNYGFCFDSPTIRSIGCAPVSGLLIEDTSTESADISWASNAGLGFEIIVDQTEADPVVAGMATTDLSYSVGGLAPSTVYYVHIRTNCGEAFGLWRTLSFTTLAVTPLNDACADAIAVATFPYTNSQDASAATNNNGYIVACQNTMNDGVWYTFTGDGTALKVTVSEVVNWDPQLDIYTGSCGSFDCVASSDGGGTEEGEEIVFVTELGTTYYANIGGYSGIEDPIEGPFKIVLENFVPPTIPENDACANAIFITAFPYVNTQDATEATNNDGSIAACENKMNDGVWYTFTGDGSDITITLANVGDWDPQIGIFSGSCGSFVCVGTVDASGTESGETITVLDSENGTDYFVNVGDYSDLLDGPEGTFNIAVTSSNLSTSSYLDATFKSYPNPVKEVLNLSYKKNISNIDVYNILGQKVLSKPVNFTAGQIDVSGLSNGTYIVKVVSGKEIKTFKIIKI